MTRTIPEPAPPSPSFRIISAGGTLRFRSRDFTTGTPRSPAGLNGHLQTSTVIYNLANFLGVLNRHPGSTSFLAIVDELKRQELESSSLAENACCAYSGV
ncbi:hypothetical protein AVEN_186238-1 [Araneus ventricosus]|uniref:Uncharacterized protein n=1 Tax=Araneus ventricosus TaxID=182803 RepID=A0A4Y2L016_ARAVE|nr:hypothetical protein AVEN_186238-1 [Araneus ventricosus]